MSGTPQANRPHIGIFGETNAGKSFLFNALTGSETAIVSDIAGTTTDPVFKAMELTSFGPVVFIDTAGFGDESELGRKRIKKTMNIINRVDLAVFIKNPGSSDNNVLSEFKTLMKENNIPFILTSRDDSADALRKEIISHLRQIKAEPETMIGGLLPRGSTVLLIIPSDSAAPKGRLILPQSQLIRDCLDHDIQVHAANLNNIGAALDNIKKIDLAVTDSQVFDRAASIIPSEIKLTSFSILMARQKGGISELTAGIGAISNLRDGDKILVTEVCTHNRTHEDIGRVKIPAALKKITGKVFDFDFAASGDFPDDLTRYAMIVHCGGCMITKKAMIYRIKKANGDNVPITNYGLLLAYASGILERSMEVLK